jgi:hypothetical protein
MTYDKDGELQSMTVDIRNQGRTTWTRTENGWRSNFGNLYQGPMEMTRDGIFKFNDTNGQPRKYITAGREVADDGTSDGGSRGGSRGASDDRSGGTQQERERRAAEKAKLDAEARAKKEAEDKVRREAEEAKRIATEAGEQAVKNSCDRSIVTRNDYKQALDDAAKAGKPIVMIIGRAASAETQQMLQQIKSAREQTKDQASYLFVDLDKVSRSSAIGRYAHEHVQKKFGNPMTMVFANADGQPGTLPAEPVFYEKGNVDAAKIVEAVGKARKEKPVDPKDKPADPPADEPVEPPADKPADKPDPKAEEVKRIHDLIQQAHNPELKNQQKYMLYRDAIDSADKLKDAGLSGNTRVTLGLACIQWGGEHESNGDLEKATAAYQAGMQWILEGGRINPSVYTNDQFAAALRSSSLPGLAADTLLERGKQNPAWYKPTAEEAKGADEAAMRKFEETMKILNEAMTKPKPKVRK